MEQFNLEKYLKNPNRKIVTKNGRKARIICTDRNSVYPVVALVSEGVEETFTYTKNGINSSGLDYLNLFFASEKHVGWVNVYRDGNVYWTGATVFDTEEEAKECIGSVATCKIEWYE